MKDTPNLLLSFLHAVNYICKFFAQFLQVHYELYAILNSDHVIFVISSPFVSAAK